VRKKWTEELVISEFKTFAEKEKDVTSKNINEKRTDLYLQIKRKFGSYPDFVVSQGYEYQPLQKTWTPESVLYELSRRYKNEESISDKVLTKENNPLKKAALRYFGSLKNAVEDCGIDYDNVREFTYWDTDSIRREFLALYQSGQIKRIEDIREISRGLDHAIRKYSGGYESLCEELGIDISTINARGVKLTKEQFIAQLVALKENGVPLNPMSVYSHIPTARDLSKEYFGSYANALASIGVNINEHITDRIATSIAGGEFESLVNEMFIALGKSYEYHYRGFDGIIPDFYEAETRTILDAKLSSWSIFNCETIEKYSPHCDKIVIIYLRGDELKYPGDNVEMRSINEYYELLKERGLEYFIGEFERIKLSLSSASLAQEVAV